MNNDPKNQPEETDPKIVRNDFNLEQWPIFTTKGDRIKNKVRQNKPTTSPVREIIRAGVDGSKQIVKVQGYLGVAEYKLWLELLRIWLESGIAPDPEGYVFRNVNSMLRGMYGARDGEKKKHRSGRFYKKWLEEKFENILDASITFQKSYRYKDGTTTDYIAFKLLRGFSLHDRKKGKYADVSKIQIDPVIVKSILKGNTMPVRVDVVNALPGEISVLLYRYLDPILSFNAAFSKDLSDIADEIGANATDKKNLIRKFKKAAKLICGKELSRAGRIAYCGVEHSGSLSGYKIVARRGDRVRLGKRVPMNVSKKDVEKKIAEDAHLDHLKKEEGHLWRYFRTLTQIEREQIEATIETISRELHGPFWNSELSMAGARLEAIRRFQVNDRSLQALYDGAQKQPAPPLLTMKDSRPVIMLEYKPPFPDGLVFLRLDLAIKELHLKSTLN